MKSLFTVILASCCLIALAQEEELQHMKVEGNNITWQKVYASVLTPAQMKEKFMELNLFESVDSDKPNRIAGMSKVISHDYVSSGYSEKDTEDYLTKKDSQGTLVVDFDEGKYRVTLKDIQLKQRVGTKKVPRGTVNRLMEYAYDNKKVRWDPKFVTNGSAKIINQTYIKKFEIGGKFDGSDF